MFHHKNIDLLENICFVSFQKLCDVLRPLYEANNSLLLIVIIL